MLTFGEPTGLELPEVEVPGSGRLLPAVGEIAGGVTEDMTMVGGFMDASRFTHLLSIAAFASTDRVDRVDTGAAVLIVTVVVLGSLVVAAALPLTVRDVAVAVVFASAVGRAVDWALTSILPDLSMEFL